MMAAVVRGVWASLTLAGLLMAGCARPANTPPQIGTAAPPENPPGDEVTNAVKNALESTKAGQSMTAVGKRMVVVSGQPANLSMNTNDDVSTITAAGHKIVIDDKHVAVDGKQADTPAGAKKFEVKFDGDKVAVLADGKELVRAP